MKKIYLIGLLLFVTALSVPTCYAGSIYAKKGVNGKGLFIDTKASKIGDILMIIVTEITKIDTEVERDLENESSRSIDFNPDENLGKAPFSWLPKIPGITDSFEASASRSMAGSSEYTEERSIEDSITVVVEDVHPNGNLVVVGSRQREVSGDMITIQVSGIVRPRDILSDNTIRSEQIANFDIKTITEGVSDNYNRPGWLASIFDALWPF